jgi:uncharacterized coiled-coil protein SlyX
MSSFKDLLIDIKSRLQSFSEPTTEPEKTDEVIMAAVTYTVLEVGGIVTDADGNPFVGVTEIDGYEVTTTDGGVITELKEIEDATQPDAIADMAEQFAKLNTQIETLTASFTSLEQKFNSSQESFSSHVNTSQELFAKFSDALEALNVNPTIEPTKVVAHRSAVAERKLAAAQSMIKK